MFHLYLDFNHNAILHCDTINFSNEQLSSFMRMQSEIINKFRTNCLCNNIDEQTFKISYYNDISFATTMVDNNPSNQDMNIITSNTSNNNYKRYIK